MCVCLSVCVLSAYERLVCLCHYSTNKQTDKQTDREIPIYIDIHNIYVCIFAYLLSYIILITLHKRALQHPLFKRSSFLSQHPHFAAFRFDSFFIRLRIYQLYLTRFQSFFFQLNGIGGFFLFFFLYLQWISCFITCSKLVDFFFGAKFLNFLKNVKSFLWKVVLDLRLKTCGVF